MGCAAIGAIAGPVGALIGGAIGFIAGVMSANQTIAWDNMEYEDKLMSAEYNFVLE